MNAGYYTSSGFRSPRQQAPTRSQELYGMAADEVPPEAGPAMVDPVASRKKRRWGFFRKKTREEEEDENYFDDVENAFHYGGQVYTEENPPDAGIVLDEVVKVNQETLGAIARTQRVVHETEAVGQESLQAVAKDNENLREIDQHVVAIAAQAQRSSTLTSAIARNVVHNKCSICLGILVIAAAIASIVTFFTVDKDGDEKGAVAPDMAPIFPPWLRRTETLALPVTRTVNRGPTVSRHVTLTETRKSFATPSASWSLSIGVNASRTHSVPVAAEINSTAFSEDANTTLGV